MSTVESQIVEGVHVMTNDERRAFVQETSKSHFRRRVFFSRIFLSALIVSLVIAFIPLFSIIQNVVGHGWHFISWKFLTTPQQQPGVLFHKSAIGGIANAITGTVLVNGVATLVAIPLSILLAIALYESKGRWMHALRVYNEVMVGLPSILLSIVVYAVIVVPLLASSGLYFTGLAGVISLTLLMIPLITVACEAALRDVPATYSEAAFALGARKSRVMMRVLLPYALPRMLTGIMLSLSRAVGETAPILFLIGSSLVTNWSLWSQQTTLPTQIFHYLEVDNPYLHNACWGIALILIIAVFVLNLTSRVIVARSLRGRK
jgi:phosphate transport system permease protein